MTAKEQIIQEIEQLPESVLEEILTKIREIKAKQQVDNDVWQAYLKSKQEREEVYRHLANS